MAMLRDRAQQFLQQQGGEEDGRLVSLSSEETRIGRLPDNTVHVMHEAVSRYHASITITHGQAVVRDLGSKNGTFVNTEAVGEAGHVLRGGEVIELGGSPVRFVYQTWESTISATPTGQAVSPLSLIVDVRAREAYVDGKRVTPPLPRKEFNLLLTLYTHRGEVVTKSDIAFSVWPERPEGDVGNHEIEQCVRRLRVHIEPDSSNPRFVQTVRGVGYRLE